MGQGHVSLQFHLALAIVHQSDHSKVAIGNIKEACWDEIKLFWDAIVCVVATANPFAQNPKVSWTAGFGEFWEPNLDVLQGG